MKLKLLVDVYVKMRLEKYFIKLKEDIEGGGRDNSPRSKDEDSSQCNTWF